MPYYPMASDARYFCPNCRVWYGPDPERSQIHCAVYHGPGSCCHYAEQKIEAPVIEPAGPGDRASEEG
jgi:hypothetical protein